MIVLLSAAFAFDCDHLIEGVVTDSQFRQGAPVEALPSNAQLAFFHSLDEEDAPAFSMEQGGQEVPVEVIYDRNWATVTPTSPLEPGSYGLMATALDDRVYFSAEFVVGEAPDTDPPRVPEVLKVKKYKRKAAGEVSRGIDVSLAEVEDAAYYEIDVSTSSEFEGASRVRSLFPEVAVGDGLCWSLFDGYDRRESYRVRARAVDLAGNRSEWSEALSVSAGSGCSFVPRPVHLWWSLWVSLGLLARRFRR